MSLYQYLKELVLRYVKIQDQVAAKGLFTKGFEKNVSKLGIFDLYLMLNSIAFWVVGPGSSLRLGASGFMPKLHGGSM